MSQARVRKMVLPNAPKQTKAVRVEDPREVDRGRRIREMKEMKLVSPSQKIDNGKQLCFWDKARVGKLQRLWNEGCPIKEIARECGANPDVTKNRISYEIKCGRIKTRKRTLTDDEREKICKMRDSGMKIQMIAKDMKCSTKTVMNILKERGKK